VAQGGDAEQQDAEGGEQPAGPPFPEAAQGDATRAGVLPQQQAGDQEPGEHEEQVDTDRPTRKTVHARVVEEHADDGDGAQTVESRFAIRSPVGDPVMRRPNHGAYGFTPTQGDGTRFLY
jgi:hypothetical protein